MLNRKANTTLHNETSTWGFYGFKTAEDTKKYRTYISLESEIHHKKISKETELYILIETMRNVNIQNIALEDIIDESFIKIQQAKDKLKTPEDQTKFERTIATWRQKSKDNRAMIQKNIAS